MKNISTKLHEKAISWTILLILSTTQLSEGNLTQDSLIEVEPTSENNQSEYIWENFIAGRIVKINMDMVNIWESQNNLTLQMAELEKENLHAIGEQIASSLQNALTAQKEEMKQYFDNALNIIVQSLPKNQMKFDEHLNCIECSSDAGELPKDCSDNSDEEQSKSGVYVLNLRRRGLRSFGVFCELFENKSWTIIQRRQDGLVDFYRNWSEYKNGFGDLNSEYWLGLDRIHELTSKQKYELWIEMEAYDGETKFARYAEFSVGAEREGYKFKVDGFSGNAADKLYYSNEMKFTTFDKRHNSGISFNCAVDTKGAWWHDECALCNPNGIYGIVTNGAGIHWGTWDKPMKYFHMALHPV